MRRRGGGLVRACAAWAVLEEVEDALGAVVVEGRRVEGCWRVGEWSVGERDAGRGFVSLLMGVEVGRRWEGMKKGRRGGWSGGR